MKEYLKAKLEEIETNSDTDHTLVVAKVGERLAVSKQQHCTLKEKFYSREAK